MSGSLNLIDHTCEKLAYLSENNLRINYCAQNAERFLICVQVSVRSFVRALTSTLALTLESVFIT